MFPCALTPQWVSKGHMEKGVAQKIHSSLKKTSLTIILLIPIYCVSNKFIMLQIKIIVFTLADQQMRFNLTKSFFIHGSYTN